LETKEITKIIRQHLKKQFPEVKFSVRTDRSGWTSKIIVEIKESPYNYNQLEYSPELSKQDYIEYSNKHNKEINAILKYCKKLLDSYNFNDSDSMTDYFHVGFYDSISVDYDYKQTEQTEEIKNDITAFRKQLIKDKKAEEERKEQEYQKWLKEQEAAEKRYQEQLKEEKEQVKFIYNNVNIKELEEQEQYHIIGSQFAHLNKNQKLETYIEEVKKGEYNLENIKITKEIHFTDKKALEYFSNMLLTDFDFLEGTGGSYTDDKRIQTMTDYYNMTDEERKTVKFNLLGVAIYYNNKLQFVVDAQGYSYARYVGLTINITIQKDYIFDQVLTDKQVKEYKTQAKTITDISTSIITNNRLFDIWDNEKWIEYKNLMKEKLKQYNIKLHKGIIQQLPEDMERLKVAMYKILIEVDGIQEQFKEVDLKQGQKITIFNISEFGFLTPSHLIFNDIEYTAYAQYDDAIKLIFKMKGKKGLYQNYYYKDLLVYDGWVDIPETLLYKIEYKNQFSTKQSK
ncbi:MAG TPA: LPD29 domain-containing protein, partial [Bacteroidales bacterium]|nr:LPD29 domain-containing protein [Bacteroidales bacterium]